MYREIITKAIIAKGEKNIIDSYKIDFDYQISKALGCYIINHKYETKLKNQKVIIKGNYEASLWYSYENNSKCDIKNITFSYEDEIPYNFTLESSNLTDKNEILEFVKTQPSCIKMSIDEKQINIDIEREFSIDIIGETKIKIKVDEVIIDEMINKDYLKDKK